MSIEARAKLLMEELKVSQKELEAMSGISQQVWSKAFNGRQRMNSAHIEFLCSEFKDYAIWLTTGSIEGGLSPEGARALEYFSGIAEKFADIKAEYDYVLMVEEYLSDTTPIVDENGIAGGSPMPSTRKLRQQEHFDQIMTQDFKVISKQLNQTDANEVRSLIDHYFYEKACKELADLNEQYGETHRIAVMLSRMFGEILLPGASSNVLSPLAQEQDPENGVDKAFFGK